MRLTIMNMKSGTYLCHRVHLFCLTILRTTQYYSFKERDGFQRTDMNMLHNNMILFSVDRPVGGSKQ
jgi:hypothetical protein